MAAVQYEVKRGDSLWKICSSSEQGPKISGNSIQAKINTVVSLNNLANANLIYPGQMLILSGDGGSSGSSTTTNPSNCPTINILAPKAESSTGRDVFVVWNWVKDHTKGFKIQWEYDDTSGGTAQTLYNTTETDDPGVRHAEFTIPETIRPYNNWVQVFITPIANTYKTKDSSGNEVDVPYWTADQAGKWYSFANNPPFTPEVPTCKIKDTTLTMEIEEIKKETDAASIIFQVVKDNSSVVYTSPAIPVVKVTDDHGKVSHPYEVAYGSKYKVRVKSVASNGKESGWTDFSEEVSTKPTAPSAITNYQVGSYIDTDGTKKFKVYIEWSAVPSATEYKVQSASGEEIVESSYSDAGTTEETSLTILDVSTNQRYHFRIIAINSDNSTESEPSEPIEIVVGQEPGKPTTWSSSDSAFAGDTMELNWIHNSIDGSLQTYAEVRLKIGDNDWVSYVYENTTTSDSPDKVIDSKWIYGQGISYKGNLYFKMDTSHASLQNKKIQWSVVTAGITEKFDYNNWSDDRIIYIYEKPTFEMSMTKDAEGVTGMIETLDSFPFYVKGNTVFKSQDYSVQKPVGYHVRIVANEFYITVDDVGETKTVNEGDAVYEKYFDTSDPLNVEISANDVDLENGISYTLYVTLDMSTGLTLTGSWSFGVSWSTDVSYNIVVDATIDKTAYTAVINPYCIDNDAGGFVENVELAVYRREYNGTYTKIASGIPNTNTSVTDPHPALDYARYRIVAKDMTTGAISFYDAPPIPVKCSSIIIQWSEDWDTFDVSDSAAAEGPAWSGSLLELKYNVEVADSRSREVSMIKYAGRENPVTYYGTHITENPTWNVAIPKDDKETIYALRRLSIWKGDVYIREPSGMGYWANVKVSFNQKFKEVTTSVSLNITKVEGGV